MRYARERAFVLTLLLLLWRSNLVLLLLLSWLWLRDHSWQLPLSPRPHTLWLACGC